MPIHTSGSRSRSRRLPHISIALSRDAMGPHDMPPPAQWDTGDVYVTGKTDDASTGSVISGALHKFNSAGERQWTHLIRAGRALWHHLELWRGWNRPSRAENAGHGEGLTRRRGGKWWPPRTSPPSPRKALR